MKKVILLVMSIMLAVGTVCFAAGEGQNDSTRTGMTAAYRQITPQEAKVRMDKNPSCIVLDVRSPEEYAAGHIPSAVLLPVEQIEAKADSVSQILPDKSAEIFVYCRSGKRAGRAAAALTEQGYTNVSSIGGIIDWPYEVVS